MKSWTNKDRRRRFPEAFGADGEYKGKMYTSRIVFEQGPKEPSENTVTRLNALKEITERVKNGEELKTICLELAERENIKKVYSMYVENGSEPINKLLENAYLAKERNKDKVKTIEGR